MTVGRRKKAGRDFDDGTAGAVAVKKEEWLQHAKERLSTLPDVRPERIRKALERVAQGFYDRPPVISKIADRFLEEMGID